MKIFGILSRYVSRSFLNSFFGVVTCLFLIILLFEFAEIQRRVSDREVDFFIKLKVVLLRAPYSLEQILPFLAFIAALFIFWRLNRANELLIFRSVGASLWRIILPISLTALMVGFVNLSAFNPLTSVMQKEYERLEKRYISRGKPKESIKVTSTGIWLSEKMGKNQVIYRADKIDLKTLTLVNPNILVISPGHHFVERIDAKTAQIQGNRLVLQEGWETFNGKSPASFEEKVIETSLNRSTIEEMKVNRETLSFWALPAYIELLETSGLKSLKYRMSWHSMLASAFWLGAMIFLAAAFSCQLQRQGKTTILVLTGLLMGFALYFFKDVTYALGTSGRLPPIIAAWLPPLLTLMVGAVLVFNQEDG